MENGSETYETSLSIYKTVQDGACRNVSGAKVAETELKKRFKGHNTTTPTVPHTA